MTYPISNNTKAYENDPYAGEADEGFGVEGNYESAMEDGEWPIENVEDSYVDEGSETSEGPCVPTGLGDLEGYVEYLKEMVASSELDEEQKAEYTKVLDKLESQLGMAHFLEGDALAQTLAEIGTKLGKIEGDIQADLKGVESEGGSGDGSPQAQIDALKKQAEDLKAAGTITQATYDSVMKDLNDAQTYVDLPNAGDAQQGKVDELINSAQDKLNTASTSPASAQTLAAQLQVSVEEVMSAAVSAGVDLNATPLKADEKLMTMFQALGIPSATDLGQLVNLQDQWKKSVGDWSAKGDAATVAWQGDSETIPELVIWQELGKLWDKTDPIGSQMGPLMEKMRTQLIDACTALGLTATAGTESDQIIINGAEMDFINEDMGAFKLDSVFNDLTNPYFSPAPRNTEASGYHASNTAEEKNYDFRNHEGQYWDSVADDYPKTTFCADG